MQHSQLPIQNVLQNTLLRSYRHCIVYKYFCYYEINDLNYCQISKQNLIIFNSFLPESISNETFE